MTFVFFFLFVNWAVYLFIFIVILFPFTELLTFWNVDDTLSLLARLRSSLHIKFINNRFDRFYVHKIVQYML